MPLELGIFMIFLVIFAIPTALMAWLIMKMLKKSNAI